MYNRSFTANGEGIVNTDMRPLLEFQAPKLLYRKDPSIRRNLAKRSCLSPAVREIIAAVETDDSWRRFRERYAILRNSELFWLFYDWLNDWNFEKRGADAGWLDLIRVEGTPK